MINKILFHDLFQLMFQTSLQREQYDMISAILEYGLAERYRYLQVTRGQRVRGVTAQAVFTLADFHTNVLMLHPGTKLM